MAAQWQTQPCMLINRLKCCMETLLSLRVHILLCQMLMNAMMRYIVAMRTLHVQTQMVVFLVLATVHLLEMAHAAKVSSLSGIR